MTIEQAIKQLQPQSLDSALLIAGFHDRRARRLALALRDTAPGTAEQQRLLGSGEASKAMRFEEAASLRDMLGTVAQSEEKQKTDDVEGGDADIFGYHAELPLVAVNVFHVRKGHMLGRREFL